MAEVKIKFHKSFKDSILWGTKRHSIRLPDEKFAEGNTFFVRDQKFIIEFVRTAKLGRILNIIYNKNYTDYAEKLAELQKFYPHKKLTYNTVITIFFFHPLNGNEAVAND